VFLVLETVTELIKEGLCIEQIARAFKLPIKLIQQQIQNDAESLFFINNIIEK
jgi:hypothetical protein